MTFTYDRAVAVGRAKLIVERHVESETLCKCCDQPWPCDVRVIATLLLEKGAFQ